MKKTIESTKRRIRQLMHAGKKGYQRLLRSKKAVDKPAERTRPQIGSEEVESIALNVEKKAESASQPPVESRSVKPTRKKWSLENFQVVPQEGKSRFHDYRIPLQVMRAIGDLDYKYCTPIQEKSLQDGLEGKDLVGKANTGTGKTAVFLIAIFSRMLTQKKKRQRGPGALVLAPTRELVMQIAKDAKNIGKYTGRSVQAVFGGVDYQKQRDNLEAGRCDLLVATPGRLLDFLGKGVVSLENCHFLVLDEADRMLDMGFIPDVRRIVGRLPGKGERQTLLFSATVSDDVKRLTSQWCTKPRFVEVESEQVSVDSVKQIIYLVTTDEKYTVLYNLIKQNPDCRMIVFANMKNEAKRLANRLQRNQIDCVLLSGDVAQEKRSKRLEMFRVGKMKILVATDVAGRGIHIDNITHVINYTLPYEPEDYVHRIGRTGRAGESGQAISFACEEGAFYLPGIEKFIERKLECVVPEESLLDSPPKRAPVPREEKHQGPKRKSYNRRRRNSAGAKKNLSNSKVKKQVAG